MATSPTSSSPCNPSIAPSPPPPPSAAVTSIEHALEYNVLVQRALVKRLRRDHGDKVLGTCTVRQAYGGMRHATSLTYETSDVDPMRGVRIRDRPLTTVYPQLPRPVGCAHPYAEAMLWLLLTGDVPSVEQVDFFCTELTQLTYIPEHVYNVIAAMPASMHPMSMLSAAVLALQQRSCEAVSKRPKTELWRDTLRDALAVIVQQTIVAAYIYQVKCTCMQKASWRPCVRLESLDLAANMARMMGFDDRVTDDLFRLHMATHMDHGGGSASCLGVRVVGSTHADAFRAWSAGLNGLSGPLHGQASEASVSFLIELRDFLTSRRCARHDDSGTSCTTDSDGDSDEDGDLALVREFVWETLRSGNVIPGYGHTTLLATDPRFHMQREFARTHLPDDELCRVASLLFAAAPDILKQHGRVRNPWPNVDAHSGVLLHNRGMTSLPFHTVMFASSRVMGPLCNLVWDRALMLPIVRPMSVTTRFIKAKFEGVENYVAPGLPEL